MASSSDTRTRGFVPPQNEDERFLMRRVEELCRTAMQRGIPRATGFLSDREQALAQAALNREDCDFARFQGGWPDAERKVLCIEPPDSWPEEPVAVLHFTAPQQGGSAVPGHRDYLGAILGLGLDRACLGDILPNPADFGNADAVPQLPERCLSRKAGIMRYCLNIRVTHSGRGYNAFALPKSADKFKRHAHRA